MRNTTLKDIIGQTKIKKCIRILLNTHQNAALPHLLFSGESGCGKTTFANAIKNETQKPIQFANGAKLKQIKEVLPYLARLETNSLFFIDEIHSVSSAVEEFMYTAMEDFVIDFTREERTIHMELPQFTLIGATTRSGGLSTPFRSRFGNHFQLEPYNHEDLRTITNNLLNHHNLRVKMGGIDNIVFRSKKIPRNLKNQVSWLSSFAKDAHINIMSNDNIDDAYVLIGIDKKGRNQNDRRYLDYLKRVNRPVGIKAIEAAIGIDAETIEKDIEPFLLRSRYISRTAKGRILL